MNMEGWVCGIGALEELKELTRGLLRGPFCDMPETLQQLQTVRIFQWFIMAVNLCTRVSIQASAGKSSVVILQMEVRPANKLIFFRYRVQVEVAQL